MEDNRGPPQQHQPPAAQKPPSALRHALTGGAVGILDVALVYPLAVLATRRECGLALRSAVRQGRFWSGGATAGTLLVPYSMAVESVSHAVSLDNPWAAALLTTCVTAPAFQVIEKKLVMDQMLQEQPRAAAAAAAAAAASARPSSSSSSSSSRASHGARGGAGAGAGAGAERGLRHALAPFAAPVRQIRAYAAQHGAARLFDGFVPFFARELCYIAAIVVVNPLVTGAVAARWGGGSRADNGGSGGGRGAAVASAFGVGWAAGWITAPFQTLSALMKHDVNHGVSVPQHMRSMFYPSIGAVAAPQLNVWQGWRRLFFGAGIRSIRTGCAGVLYFQARHYVALWHGEDDEQ